LEGFRDSWAKARMQRKKAPAERSVGGFFVGKMKNRIFVFLGGEG